MKETRRDLTRVDTNRYIYLLCFVQNTRITGIAWLVKRDLAKVETASRGSVARSVLVIRMTDAVG